MFVRQSSGLVREFSLGDVITINIAGVNLGIVGALSIAAVAGLWPGASMILVVIIGAIVSLATVGTYGLMSAAMPRSGGDYVFVGRSLSPWIGFLANWMITWSLFVLLGLFSVGIVTQALAPAMAAFGYVADANWWVTAANDLVNEKGLQAVVALIFMVSAAAIALSGPRAVKLTFRVLTIVGLVGLGVGLIVLLTTSASGFTERMDTILAKSGGNSIEGMMDAARNAGFTDTPFSMSATLSAIPYAFYAFVGLTYTSYLGGEIQRPQRSQPMGMLIALAVCLSFYILFFIGVYTTMGWDNIHAWAYLAGEAPDEIGFFGGSPLGSFLLGGVSSSPLVSFIVGLAFVAWFYMILLFAIVMPVRNLFAWSLDRVIPEKVSEVTDRGTPWVATLIISAIAIGALFVAIFSDFISLVINYTLFYSITFFLAGIAATVFPYRRPDLLERAPKPVQRRIGNIPLLTIAGSVQTVVFAVIIIEALSNPAFGGPTGRNALLFIVALLIAGPALFFYSRSLRRKQGYDPDATWRGLPPD